MTTPYTAEELNAEYAYRWTERIGIMCGDAEPTPEQGHIAAQEARQAISLLRGTSGPRAKPGMGERRAVAEKLRELRLNL